MGTWGIFTGFSENVLIEDNETSHSVSQHGIYVSNSADNPVIRGNRSWGNHACGIHMNGDVSMGDDGIISGALIEGNIIHDNGSGGGSGINCDGVQNSVIRNNLLYNNHASGISLYAIDGAEGSKNNLVVNNTIIEAADGRWAVNIQGGSTGNTVLNNILLNNHSWHGSISISANSLPGFSSDHNIVEDRFTPDDGDSMLTLSQWRSQTGQDGNSIVASQASVFRNVVANDYHLSATSPAIDNGMSLTDVATDIEGNPRPQGSGWDIGAYESYTPTIIYVSTEGSCNDHNPCRTNIHDGLSLISGQSIIEITEETYHEHIVLDFDQEITLEGGWDTNFTSCLSYATINGSLTITHGTIVIEKIILK
jgi:parallel beta-helix repeat protein